MFQNGRVETRPKRLPRSGPTRQVARILPELAQYVGEDPVELEGSQDPRVFFGNGYVAKIGSPDVIERERTILTQALGPMPMGLPHLIDWDIAWLVTEDVPDSKSEWTDEELMTALGQLAELHDDFESGRALESPALRRPLGRDLGELLAASRSSGWALPEGLSELLANPASLVEVMRAGPQTLLHGDPWPWQIRRSGSELVWVNWGQASVGPAAADLASWLDQTPFHVGRPIDRLGHIHSYLDSRKKKPDQDEFFAALDAARVLWFLAFDVPNLPALAESSPDLAETMNHEATRANEAFVKAAAKLA